MTWLSSPKVRLALIVNGLYFISLFTPAARHGRPHFFARARATQAARAVPAAQSEYVPLPPPAAPSRASAYESGGLLRVSLNNDLTLVKRHGHTLLLSPSFSARTYPQAKPDSVLFNFILYSDSDQESCPGECPLTITADDTTVWTAGGMSESWTRENVPRTSTKLEDGQVVETLAAESLSTRIPYDFFLRILEARRVRVKLGPDRVELTADQIEALRDMHRRLPQPPPPDDSDSY